MMDIVLNQWNLMNCLKTNTLHGVPQIASHLEKRAGKEESFLIIKKAVNGEELTERDWAVMYSYFLPPKPKKITNAFEWLSLVCDQKEQYSFCKYILSEEGKLIAANTKAAHVLYSNLDLEDGWYDTKKGKAGNDVAIMPNVNQAIDEAAIEDYDFSEIDFDIIETSTGLAYILPWNNKGVDKKYFDMMIKPLSEVFIQYSIDGPFIVGGVIGEIECDAVIMPFNINGFLDKQDKE